ncbi:MAG: hypothetical protein JWQ09_656 [Segetibacter sp.]|nr:hypothetical protein [Segetibacter sp.]
MQEDNIMQEPTRLNEQQLEMLRLLKKPLPEQDYKEIKKFIVKILARNVDDEMERLEKEKGWTEENYEQWGKEHMRTPYKK